MRDYIEERAIHIAQYIVDNGATVRQTARQFGVSKSTVHKDVTQRLIQINPRLAFQTRIILDINKSERHIRGGMATREKYRHHTQNVTFSSNIHAPCGNTEYSDTHSKDSEFPQVHRRTPPDRRHHFDSRLHSSLEFDPATDFYGMSDIHRAVIQQSQTAEYSGKAVCNSLLFPLFFPFIFLYIVFTSDTISSYYTILSGICQPFLIK